MADSKIPDFREAISFDIIASFPNDGQGSFYLTEIGL
jgi:hypothetical protein